MWLRMDHQTFRKLPRSNGIIFGVYVLLVTVGELKLTLIRHVMLKRLEDLVETPLVPALLAKIHVDGDRALMDVRTMVNAVYILTDWLDHSTKMTLSTRVA